MFTHARVWFLLFAFALISQPVFAQIPQASDTTSTPTPGAHDYLGTGAETVNPANGSVSIRIPVRMPQGRQLTVPFSFAYDSNGAFYIGPPNQGGAPRYLSIPAAMNSKGGWSYSFPVMSFQVATWKIPGSGGGNITCHGSYNYVFQDPAGNRHNLGLSVSPNIAGGNGQNCSDGFNGDGEYPTGGEGPILATTSIPANGGFFPATSVTDGNGTVYSFTGQNSSPVTSLATTLVDRNGNTVNISNSSGAVTYRDTIGRTALTTSGLGGSPDTITLAGLTSPYEVHWTTASASFTDNMLSICTGAGCQSCPTSLSASSTVVSSIVLPNGQQYTFLYDGTYGMLKRITYPTGGYVRYVWGLNSHAEDISTSAFNGVSQVFWDCRYDFPAITDRYVSYDGSTETLHQHFSYNTTWPSNTSETWTSKTTTVTTTDVLRNTSFTTVYTYLPIDAPSVPNNPGGFLTAQIPLESTIQYSGTTGSLLRTVTKGWYNGNARLLASEQDKLDNNQSSLTVYCYNSNEQITEVDEHDLGTAAPTLPTCANGVPSATVSGPVLRKTTKNYASFTAHIVDLPSSIITSDGSGNRVAETDNYYDQTGGTNRGNLTTTTKQCFNLPGGQACPQGNSSTVFTYDANGQMLTEKEPNGNQTSYSYADNYSSCGGNAPPISPSDAYLTQVTYPQTNGINHVVSNCYDYTSGLMLSSTDQNNQTTHHKYADSLDRLTETDFPDGGKTTISYGDAAPNPTITTNRLMSSTSQYVTSTITMDGLGHATKNVLTPDPDCSSGDRTDTTYDGLGRAYTVSNPYCTTGDSTYGVITYTYDALGRITTVKAQDGNTSTTSYSGNCVTATDPTGKALKSCSDGLGRLTQVFEDPSGLNYQTVYTYDGLDNLTAVVQNSSRNRSFAYDSLSRLTSATNPESGTITYSYDANGNLLKKTDARGISAQTGYDALNRPLNTTYSDGSLPFGYSYDTDTHSLPGSAANGIGRVTVATNSSSFGDHIAYDVVGRVTKNWNCISGLPNPTSDPCPPTVYTYDLAGNVTSITYPSGRVVKYAYNGVSRPKQVTFDSFRGTAVGYSYVSSATYAPVGAPGTVSLGSGLMETSTYNSRLQPLNQKVSSSTLTALYRSYSFYDASSHNSGNVMTISDNLEPNRTQGFTYDQLNRISTARSTATSGPDCWAQRFGYDSWGNLLTETPTQSGCPMTSLNIGVNSKNQITNAGFSYDVSGNLLADGLNHYAYDAESRIVSLNSGAASYTYGTAGHRVIKQVGSGSTDYVYGTNGEVLEECDTVSGLCSDYIYLGHRRLARSDTFESRIHISGTTCGGSCGAQNAYINVAAPTLTSYVLRTGDKLYFTQYQAASRAGIVLPLTDGTYATGNDQNGNNMGDDPNQNQWDTRIVDLSAYSGKTIQNVWLAPNSRTPPGNWNLWFESIVLVSSDGTAIPIYAPGNSASLSISYQSSGIANLSAITEQVGSTTSSNTTTYDHADHLGSARLISTSQGFPIWSAIYLPFGQEWNAQTTVNHYKFTGKERDSESSLDNFGARYYGSSLGRFMSADPDNAGASEDNPQSWNAYAYVINNPLNDIDPDGRWILVVDGGPDADLLEARRIEDLLRQVGDAANRLNNHLQTAWDWYRTSQVNTGCLAAATASGAAAGAALGVDAGAAGGGLLGLAGGPAAPATVPLSAAGGAAAGGFLGAAGGAAVGNLVGQIACRTGAPAGGGGGGGGGGRASGSSARLTKPQQRQTAEYLGMKEVKGLGRSQGQLVFEKGGRYFSFSNTSHTAGEVFKELDRNGNRIATTDLNLNRIGP